MDYQGPEPADLANVYSLNRAFLAHLRDTAADRLHPHGKETDIVEKLAALDARRLRYLGRVPFLLLSLRENDDDCWTRLFSEDIAADLLAPLNDAARLQAASLAFLWQLARRNAYAARLVSGASLSWCERLCECTLVDALARAGTRGDLLAPRLADNPDFWGKLLGAGTSAERDVRVAARL